MLSNNPAFSLLAVLFLVGAGLFAAGTWLARVSQRPGEANIESPAITWTHGVANSTEAVPWELRLDLIERLATVGRPWCIDALKTALNEETEPVIREAADRALIVIQSRAINT